MNNLLEEWVPRVYRFALRLSGDVHAADDLTQDTFLRAWKNWGQLRDTAAARVWLFRITANLWNDRLRRGRSPVAQAGLLTLTEPARTRPPEQVAAGREELALAMEALDNLPPRQREVLYLSACEGLTAAETADVLGITVGAAKTNLSLARKAMREMFPNLFPEPVRAE